MQITSTQSHWLELWSNDQTVLHGSVRNSKFFILSACGAGNTGVLSRYWELCCTKRVSLHFPTLVLERVLSGVCVVVGVFEGLLRVFCLSSATLQVVLPLKHSASSKDLHLSVGSLSQDWIELSKSWLNLSREQRRNKQKIQEICKLPG